MSINLISTQTASHTNDGELMVVNQPFTIISSLCPPGFGYMVDNIEGGSGRLHNYTILNPCVCKN